MSSVSCMHGLTCELTACKFIGTIPTDAEKNEDVFPIFVMLGATV